MTIAFVHNHRAFLPGLYGYRQFFSRYGIQCEVVTPDQLSQIHRHVEWFFLGTDFSSPHEGMYKIHEYPSASLPPFRKWKDWFKSYFNAQPDFRIFQNEFVRKSMGFHDSIPYGFRDLGVPTEWLEPGEAVDKEYDFIYIGDVSARRNMEKLLGLFQGRFSHRSLLILSHHYEELQKEFEKSTNIQFKGPVPKEEVRDYLRRSRFAFNYIPDIVPFNEQTSTKLLEYAACGVPIISTRYKWVEEFQALYGGNFYYVKEDLSDLEENALENFAFAAPDLQDWTWEQQIRNSGVLEFLISIFPELQFEKEINP